MTPDPYRKAYEKALEDVTHIAETFERLSARKKLLENLLLALQSVFTRELAPQEAPVQATIETSQVVHEESNEMMKSAEPAAGYSFLDVPAPLPTESDGDPFQRRVRAGNFRFKGHAAHRSY